MGNVLNCHTVQTADIDSEMGVYNSKRANTAKYDHMQHNDQGQMASSNTNAHRQDVYHKKDRAISKNLHSQGRSKEVNSKFYTELTDRPNIGLSRDQHTNCTAENVSRYKPGYRKSSSMRELGKKAVGTSHDIRLWSNVKSRDFIDETRNTHDQITEQAGGQLHSRKKNVSDNDLLKLSTDGKNTPFNDLENVYENVSSQKQFSETKFDSIQVNQDQSIHTKSRDGAITAQSRRFSKARSVDMSHMFKGHRQRKLIVAFDIGATMSGFAYSSDTVTDTATDIHLNELWQDEFGSSSKKTPTAVLMDNNKMAPVKFGFEALVAYTTASEPSKLSLFNTFNSVLNKQVGASMSIIPVGQLLEFVFGSLNQCVENQLEKTRLGTDRSLMKVRYVLTKRHEADENEEYMLLQNAAQVTLSRDIIPIREDKAVAWWCQSMPIFEFSQTQDLSFPAGTRYGILDLEGNYLSIFKKENKVTPRHISKQSINYDIHSENEDLFNMIFDKRKIEEYKSNHPRDWFVLLHKLQTQIHGFNYDNDIDICVSLPYTFVKYFEKGTKNIKKYVGKCHKKELSYINDSIMIHSSHFRKLFDSYATEVWKYLNDQSNYQNQALDYLFLIGRADLIENPIRKLNHDNPKIREIKVPLDASACALKGAIMYAKTLIHHF